VRACVAGRARACERPRQPDRDVAVLPTRLEFPLLKCLSHPPARAAGGVATAGPREAEKKERGV